jgi:hypothetical protein
MHNLLRLFVGGGLGAFAVFIVVLGLGRNNADLMVPANLVVLAIAAVVYVLPTVLAVHRNCKATAWISAVNIFLGWTVFGWFAAIGWAATGKARTLPPTIGVPPGRAIPGH